MVYGDLTDLLRRTASQSITAKAFNFAKNPKFDGYQRGLASMVYKFFNKKLSAMCAQLENLIYDIFDTNIYIYIDIDIDIDI